MYTNIRIYKYICCANKPTHAHALTQSQRYGTIYNDTYLRFVIQFIIINCLKVLTKTKYANESFNGVLYLFSYVTEW